MLTFRARKYAEDETLVGEASEAFVFTIDM